MRVHEKLAADVWRMLRGLMGEDLQVPAREAADLDASAIRLIEMACDSAAESQRVADGHPPRGGSDGVRRRA